MRLAFIAIATTLSLSACDSDQNQKIMAMERQIQSTVQSDWRDGIPLDDLVDASLNCQKFQDLKGCKVVEHQMEDIATSLAACHADQRSTLCQVVIRIIGKHPITSMLPKARALKLPDSPWYWNLPTTALEAHSSNLGYRIEAVFWWRDKWRAYILSFIALLVMAIAWILWSEWNDAKQQRANELARRREALIKQKKSRRIRDEQARIKIEQQAELKREAALMEQQCLAAEKLAEQQATEAAAKLAAEQTEALSVLNAAFVPTKPKRRKRDPSSK